MTALTQTARGEDQATIFGRAIAARDFDTVSAIVSPDVRFRYLIPPGPNQVDGPTQVASTLRIWFGDAADVRIEQIEVGPMADRTSLRYRLILHRCGEWQTIEQQLYLDIDESDLICSIDLLCTGFRPAPHREPHTTRQHHFNAGTLGCADGLAQEFRRRILAIPLGDVLIVETIDPAAKEDLPPLARLMGHKVHSIEPSEGGRLLVKVERGR